MAPPVRPAPGHRRATFLIPDVELVWCREYDVPDDEYSCFIKAPQRTPDDWAGLNTEAGYDSVAVWPLGSVPVKSHPTGGGLAGKARFTIDPGHGKRMTCRMDAQMHRDPGRPGYPMPVEMRNHLVCGLDAKTLKRLSLTPGGWVDPEGR
jgi:hypothetical protein